MYKIETSIDIPDKLYRGNSIDIGVRVNLDLSEYIINVELFDQYCSSLKLSSEDENSSIELLEDDESFIVHILKDTTSNFHLVSYLEITLIDSDDKEITCYFAPIKFIDNFIWRK